jgi:tetratricopeptide (TPR) repeat protein
MYYLFVTGDLENTTRVFREWLGSYPSSSTALGNLALTYGMTGQYQQAVDLNRESLQRQPDDVIAYAGLARTLISLNRFAEARATIQDALDRKLDSDNLHSELYQLAFLAADDRGMAEQVAWSNTRGDAMQRLLPLEASTEAYSGHLQKARELSRQAVDSSQHAGRNEAATSELMRTALREASFGNLQEARKRATSVAPSELGQTVRHTPRSPLPPLVVLAMPSRYCTPLTNNFPKARYYNPSCCLRFKLASKSQETRREKAFNCCNLPHCTN